MKTYLDIYILLVILTYINSKMTFSSSPHTDYIPKHMATPAITMMPAVFIIVAPCGWEGVGSVGAGSAPGTGGDSVGVSVRVRTSDSSSPAVVGEGANTDIK